MQKPVAVVGIHGGTLLFSPPGKETPSAAIAGASVDPETLVNQARKIDDGVLAQAA